MFYILYIIIIIIIILGTKDQTHNLALVREALMLLS